MNWKTTLLLVILAGLAGVWLWKGDEWGPTIGLTPRHPEPPPSEAIRVVDAFTPAGLTRVEVAFESGDPLVLERGGDGWRQPGNWPARQAEVEELVQTLGTLRTRFHAIPFPDGADPSAYGLAAGQKPLPVTVVMNGERHTLLFGDPKPTGGETAFTRPAYVRVDDIREVLKLGPDVMPVLRRPAETYRRRTLFPDVERVKVANGDAPVTLTLPGEATETIRVASPAPRLFGFRLPPLECDYTLERRGKLPPPAPRVRGGEAVLNPDRVADAWELTQFRPDGFPFRDRADPARLTAALAAVGDLWVDQFVAPADAKIALDSRFAVAEMMPVLFEPPLAAAVRLYPEVAILDPIRQKLPLDDRTGLGNADHAVSVKRVGGAPMTVRFGGIAKVGEREETIEVPGGPPGSPPRTLTEKVPFPYRFARVDGSPLVFVVPADKLPGLFVAVGKLFDYPVARFSAGEVQEVTLRTTNRPEGMKLVRTKGNPKATDPEEQADRWSLDAKPNPLPADAGRVNALLQQLARLSAAAIDQVRYPTAAPAGRTRVTVVAREARPEGEPDAPAREYTLLIDDPDPVKHLLPVGVAGSPRVTLVDNRLGDDDPDSWLGAWLFPNTLSDLFARPALAYRGRKLLSTTDPIKKVVLLGKFVLTDEDSGWKLTEPFLSDADPDRAKQLATSLLKLQATEHLADSPTRDELKAFGLENPAGVVQLTTRDKRTYTLKLGSPRPGKPEVFAQLDDGSVFALPDTVPEQLTAGALGLLPLKMWATTPEKVTALEVVRHGDAARDSFTLTRDGTNWKLTGPFTAAVKSADATPLLTALGNLTAVKYQSLSSANAAEFGLDKPLLSLKLTFLARKPDGSEAPETRTLAVGGPTPDGAGRYAVLDGPVIVVPAGFVAAAQTPPLELLDRALLSLDTGRVTTVRVAPEKPEDAFTLTNDGKGKWAVEGVGFAVDRERIDRLLVGIILRANRIAAYGDAVKWADFGLDKPEATVTVTLGGDKPETHTIALGKPDPDSGGRFARMDNGPAVAVLAPAAAAALTRKKFEYADRTLLTFDPATVTGLTRKQGKDELELAPGAAVGWDIVKPARHKGDGELMDELVAALGKLRADRVAAYGKKDDVFKQHGLEPAAAVLMLTVGDKAEQKTLRIGNPVDPGKPDGERYAAVESAAPEAIVGVLPSALANKLLAPTVAFRDRSLAKFVDADKAVLERGDRKVTFAKVGGTWKVTEPLATAAESAELDALVADLGKLRVETWVAEKGADLKPFGLDKPQVKWTLSDGDRTVLVLLLGKTTADGRVHVATDKSELVGLLDAPLTGRVLAEYRQRRPWDVDATQVEVVDIATGASKFQLAKIGPVWLEPAKPTDTIDLQVVNELLGTLAGLRVERYAADKDADPKLFGLEKPEVTLALVTPQGKRVLEIGGAVGGTDGKQRYARIAGRTDVFVLSAADTARLTRDRPAYVMKK